MADRAAAASMYLLDSTLRKKYATSAFFNLHKKYRGHFEIIALMLEAVKDNGETRFSIMKNACINTGQLKQYLKTLTTIGFVEIEIKDRRVTYRTSEKGLEFLKQYYVLLEMLSNAQTRSRPINVVYGSTYRHDDRRGVSAQIIARLPNNH